MATSVFPPGKLGGVSNHVCNISSELVRRGHEVTVITRGSMKGPEVSYLSGLTVYRVRFLPLYPFHAKLFEFFFTKNFRTLETDFDIVHYHLPLSPIAHTQLPTVVTVHSTGMGQASRIELRDFYSFAHKLFNVYRYSIESKALRNADIITAVSKKVAEELHRYHDVKLNSIITSGNGVDTNFFVPRKNNEIDEETYVLFCGSLIYQKGLLDLVKSAKYILQKHPEVSFVLAGEGPLERALKNIVRKLKFTKKFVFLGYVNQNKLLRYYQDATVCVLPSYYEGLPSVLLEAMACGVPIVATNVGGVSEFVVNEKNGLIIPMKDPKLIADAVSRLVEDDDLRTAIGKAGRKTVQKCFGWERIANKILDCYELARSKKNAN